VNGFVTACGTCVSSLTELVRHLSNEGVEETPPSAASFQNGFNSRNGPDPRQLFVNLEGCNVGFNLHWHPSPVTQNGNKLAGQGDMGGVWEWTGSVLEPHEGYEPMALYPAYSGKPFILRRTGVMLMISSRFL
jgi:formylglycine-generating enzyme required for sulfatase activity